MRYLMMVQVTPSSESAEVKRADLDAMGKFNQQMRDAGVLVTVDGLRDSSLGTRIAYKGGEAVVRDGPFTESKELIAGFWILNVKSKQEAIEWAKRIPFRNGEGVEIRQIAEAADFKDIK
jgi:hypothetical protein